jgi:hypothetical protein
MGLFYSLPKDVFKHHILIHLGYLDRIRIYSTCKCFHQQMKEHDPLSSAIITKDWTSALCHLVKWAECCNNISEFIINMPQPLSDDMCINLALCTTKLCIISYFRLCMQETTRFFDEEVATHLYYKFKGNIPEEYFKVLTCSGKLCAAFARIGNYLLYKRFYDEYDSQNFGDDSQDGDYCLMEIAFAAGRGSNIEICRHFMSEHSYLNNSIARGIAYSGNMETLDAVIGDKEHLIEVCFKECIEHATDRDQDFCWVAELNVTCKHLLTKYPKVWEKIKLNKKRKL